MTTVPNLYLKWRAFRAMLLDERSDADLSNLILVDDEPERRASKFSKLLKGDVGLKPRVADAIAEVMNGRIQEFRRKNHPNVPPERGLSGSDLLLPVFDFVRRMITIAETFDPGGLERAHTALLDTIAPWRSKTNNPPRLLVEPCERFDWVETGEPIEFEPGDLGRFAIAEEDRNPKAVYVFAVRDTSAMGHRLWDFKWGQTVLWLPSPFEPERLGDVLVLTGPQEIKPMHGRFLVTAILIFDETVQEKLDPRGKTPGKGGLDEEQTSRFLTNLHQIEERLPQSIAIATNEYIVVSK